MIGRKCLPLVTAIAVWGFSGLAAAANWTSVVQEDPGVILMGAAVGGAKLKVAPDGALFAYPLPVPIRDSVDGDDFALAARFGTSGATALTSAGTAGFPLGQATLLSDGSTVIVSEGVIGRYAVDGSTLWVTPTPGGVSHVIEIDGQSLLAVGASANGLVARRFTTSNGVLVESALLSTVAGYCTDTRLVGAGAGASFAGGGCVPNGLIKILSSPLRADLAWQPTPDPISGHVGQLVDADATGVLVMTPENSRSILRKLSIDSGATIWRFPDVASTLNVVDVFQGPAGALIAVGRVDDAQTVHRVDPQTGASLWNQSTTGPVTAAAWLGSNLLLAGMHYDAAPHRQGFVQRVDPATGAVQWQHPLIATRGGGYSTADVAIQSGQAVVIGADCPAQVPGDGLVCAATLWRGDLVSGQIVSMDEVRVRSGNAYAGLASLDSGEPTLATLEMGPVGSQLRIRRVQAIDGSTAFDAVVPVEMSLPWWLPEIVRVIPTRDGNYAALLTRQYRGQSTYASDAVVYKINGSTGAVMWRRSLIDFSMGCNKSACWKSWQTARVTSSPVPCAHCRGASAAMND